jgi:hypothetical protein
MDNSTATMAQQTAQAPEVEPATGTAVALFTTGTVVHVHRLARNIAAEAWNASGPGDQKRVT